MMSRPASRRIYFRILYEYLDGYWSREKATPWMSALQRDIGLNTGGILGFIANRVAGVRSQINSSTNTTFRIRTNSGNDITTDETSIRLEGEAPAQVAQLFYSVGGGDLVMLEPEWTTQVRWRADFELSARESEFQFIGFSTAGEILGTDSIVVESTAIPNDPVVTSWSPRRGSVGGGFEVTVWDPAQHGVPTLGLTYITRQDVADDRPELVEKFLKATLKGVEFVLDEGNMEKTLDIILKFASDENREHQRFMLEVELRDAVGPVTDRNGVGWMTSEQWQALYDHLIEVEALPGPYDFRTAFTDEFLRAVYDGNRLRWPLSNRVKTRATFSM